MRYFYFYLFLLGSFISSAQGLTGEFTVGDLNSDYETFTQMIVDLQAEGVGDGGATFTIVPGTYSDILTLESIPGLSETSPLIITAEPDSVFFEIIGTSSSTDAAFTINALSYITFENLNIRDISDAGNELERGFSFVGSSSEGCSFNIVRDCSIFLGANGARPLTSTRGIRFVSDASSQEATNSNNLIDNVSIDNSGSGIQILASADFFGRVDFEDTNNQIINSSFGSNTSLGHDLSSGSFGINTLGNKDMLIQNNVFESITNLNASPVLPVSTSAISIDSGSGEISQNTINYVEYEGTIGSTYGMKVSTISGDSTVIANNKISGLVRSNFTASTSDPSLYLFGVWVFEQDGNVGLTRLLHNTIVLEAEEAVSYPSAGIQLRSGSSGQPPAEVFNNIITNSISTEDEAYRSYALVDGNSDRGFLVSDYNLLFADGVNGFLGSIGRRLGETEQFTNDLAEFISFSETNENSVSFSPVFQDIASNDFSISPDVENPLDYVVPRLEEIDQDILGNLREDVETYLGAYEGTVFLTISNINPDGNITVYPNPASSFISLELLGLSIDENTSMKIYNMNGQLVFDTLIKSENDLLNIGINNLSSGLYILKVNTESKLFTERFVVE